MTTTTLVGLVAGTLTSIAVVPQVVRTWQTKHARDISIWQPILLVVGMGLWLVYGLSIGDIPLIAANTFSIFWYTLLICLKLVYDRRDAQEGRLSVSPQEEEAK